MAARLNPRHQLMVREKIKASQIANLLQKEALGLKTLKPGQRDSAKYLLSQAIGLPPQMSDVTFTGLLETNDISDKPLTAEQWAAQADHMGADTGSTETTD